MLFLNHGIPLKMAAENTTMSGTYWNIIGLLNNRYGDSTGNKTASNATETPKPTAVANYIIILFFLFPVVVMSILCFLRIRVNNLSRRDKGYWGRPEYLYRIHSLASQAPAQQEMSQPLTNGHFSRHASQSSNKSGRSNRSSRSNSKDEDAIKPV